MGVVGTHRVRRRVAVITAGLLGLTAPLASATEPPPTVPESPVAEETVDPEATPAPVTVTGDYEVLGAISPPGTDVRSEYLATVTDDAGRRHRLDRPLDDLVTGARVRVQGFRRDGVVVVESFTVLESAPRRAELAGTSSILVVMVQWTGPDTTTAAELSAELSGEARPWFTDVSYGKWTINTPSVTGWLPIAPTDGCDWYGVMQLAIAAAEDAGWNTGAFDHVMIYHPFDSDCWWGGLGYVNGGITWVNGTPESPLMIHELGHNIGLGHAMSATCRDPLGNPVVLSTDCTLETYGDLFDAMGHVWIWDWATNQWGAPAHFSGTNKERLGWFDGRTVDVTRNGTITLVPLARRTAGVQGARVHANGRTYWIEYRRPIGTDTLITSIYPQVTEGAVIRVDGWETMLLDGRPSTVAEFSDASLPLSSSWTSPEGVTFTVVARSTTSLRVSIAFPTCNGLAPTIIGSGYIVGTAGNDVIIGSSGADEVDARGGNDTICTLAGDDRVLGGTGRDVVFGGDGDDLLSGQAGDDVLRGGDGFDLCVKGSGAGAIYTCEMTQLPITVIGSAIVEGNSGIGDAGFVVSIPIATDLIVKVTIRTLDGYPSEPNEPATAGEDYVAMPPTVFTLAPGSTVVSDSVQVIGDTRDEPDEVFTLEPSNPQGGAVLHGLGVVTIVDDDEVTQPALSINDVAVAEGNSGTKAFTFTVTLDRASADTVTVKYRTVNGTATAGSDYTLVPLTVLTFPPGTTTRQVTVLVTGDRTVEPAERFFVDLSAPSKATIADNRGRATILNDD